MFLKDVFFVIIYNMHDAKEKIEEYKKRINLLKQLLNIPHIQSRILELEKETVNPDLWADEKKASVIMQELSYLKQRITKFFEMEITVNELADYYDLMRQEEVQIPEEFLKDLDNVEAEIKSQELEMLLSGKFDNNNAILSIYAGAGGVDAQDWANMLLRMYLRFAENKKYKTQIVSISGGEEAGIKSAIVEVSGPLAYGYLKGESGVHRLVRLSPFNAQHLRQTSFALIDVIPEIEKEEIKIDPKDLRIETFRASGAGGQHVNVTDSAVRITHLPSKITSSSQSERSQLQNKETALKILKAKLAKYHEEKSEEEKAKLRGEISSASWGNQIRSYVLHPYNLVKDHRTNLETSNIKSVLDGEIEQFIEANLRKKK